MGNTISDRSTVVNEFKKIKSDTKEEVNIPYYQWLQILEEEIRNDGWNEEAYKDIKITNTLKPKEENFCKWLKTQKELFEKIKSIGPTKITWSWEEEPKKLINSLLNKYHKNTKYQIEQCGDVNKIKLTVENGKENKDEVDLSTSSSCNLPTIEGLCIPRRRRQLNIKNIYNTLLDVETNLKIQNVDLNEKLRNSILATTAVGSIGQLAKNEIIELYKKYHNKDNIICNVLKRNFSDYNNIINSNDIVNDSTSKKIQCKIQEIRKNIGNKEDIQQLWKTNFQEPFQNQLKDIDELKDPDTGNPCQVDSNYTIPQCVRFFEEWLEEFLDEKTFVEKYIYSACNENSGKRFKNKGYLKCDDYCKHYKNILQSRKQCYEKYLQKCKESYENESIYQAEIDVVTRRIKTKIHCDDTVCSNKSTRRPDLSPLFDENNVKTNLIYHCNCDKGKTNKDQAPCKDKSAISGNLSLKGDWQTAAKEASKRGGARSSEGDDIEDPCELDWEKHSVGGKSVDANPCKDVSRNSEWKCDVKGMEKGICLPPRRQRLCISNIKKLGKSDINGMDTHKLLLETMLAAKQEGERLWKESVSNSRNYDNFCQNIKRSYFDFRDIIKGRDKLKDKYGKNTLENNIKSIFHQIYEQLHDTQKNKYGNDSDINYTKLRENWWNENRDDIWNAFICGTKQYVPRITPGQIKLGGGEKKKSLVCENKGLNVDSPPDENVPQFLRWFEEWAQDFCVKRKQEHQLVHDSCKKCSDGSCDNGLGTFLFSLFSSIGCNCKEQCDKYSKWMDTQKSQFDKQKNKYNQLKDTLEYTFFTDSGNKSAPQYLDEKFSETKCKINNNNDLKFDNPKTFSSYPDVHEQKCSKCSPQLEVYLGKNIDGKNEKTPCEITDRDIMNGAIAAPCNTEKTNKKEWDCNEISKLKSHSKTCVPNRTTDLCLAYLNHQNFKDYVTKVNEIGSVNEKFLKGVILQAKQEGEKIWEYYVDKKKQNSDDINKKKEACKIMKRNFADLGDIIKGTDIWNKKNGQIENNMNKIFEKIWEKRPDEEKYIPFDTNLPALRNDWWDSNKDSVWEAFKCKGTGNECGKHEDIDRIPQFLRWLEEWSENFCEQRKKKLNDMKKECDECKSAMKGQNDISICGNSNCIACKKKCNEYKNWKKEWKDNWDKLKDYYKKEKNNGDGLLKNYVNDKEIEDFVKKGFNDKCEYDKILNDSNEYLDTPHEYNTACDCVAKIELAKKSVKNAEYSNDGHNTLEKNICKETFEDGWIEWDCNQKHRDGYSVCMKKNPNIDEKNYEFVEWFNEWIGSFLDEYSQFEDNECTDNKNGNTNSCVYETCRDKCYCYNKWAAKRKIEWELLQTYYDDYNKKNSDGLGSITGSILLDTYLETSFDEEFEPLNGIYETPTQQMISKFNHSVMKSEECVEKCPKKLECHEKGFVTGWECEKTNGSNNEKICVKKGENKYAKPKLNEVDVIDRFYDSFNDWLNDMEHMLEENMKLLEYSCNKKKTYKNKNPNICFRCKNDCECYEKFKGEIKTQWEKLKGYYDHYKSKPENKMHNIELDTYLQAQCEYNLTEMGKKLDIAEKQCKKKDTNKATIFEEMVDNIDKKKDNVCDVCQEENKYDEKVDDSICNKIIDISRTKCKPKVYDDLKKNNPKNTYDREKEWKCTEEKGKETLEPNVCVPPRGQSICVANMYDSAGGGNIVQDAFKDATTMKDELKRAIKTETKLLWEKFGTNSSDHEKACRLTHRSLNDFKHMVIGDSIWKPASIGDIEKEIGKKISTNGGNTAAATTREQWWQQHEKEFWNATKCGIKEATSGNTGNECPRFISEDDQFEWWAKEWSDDFYEKRHEVATQVDAECSKDKDKCNGAGGTMKPGGCKTKCDQYKDFLKKKKGEWDGNFIKYLKEKEKQQKNSGVNTKEYMPQNHYLISTCANHPCNGKEFIGILSNNKEYGEYQNTCTCKVDTQSTENPCDTNYTEYGCTEKKFEKNIWSSTYVTNPQDHGRVFAPPRRNSICIGWLFSPLESVKSSTSGSGTSSTGGKDPKDELKNKIMDAAKGEAHYLHKYYKDKQAKNSGASGSPGNTEPPPGYCEALKRSFADIGDIVKGTDLWSGGYSELVENNIHAVFQLDNDGKNNKLIKTKEELFEERKQWWNTIRGDVWKEMNKCNNNKCGDATIPDDDQKPQFLRWLEEWAEHMCEERQKHLTELNNKCNANGNNINDGKCAKATDDCKKQCNIYNNWINVYKREWLGQKSKYNEIIADRFHEHYDDFNKHMKGNTNANTYIEKQCKSCDKCKSGSTNVNMDAIFNKTDDDYKKYEPFCTTCRLKDIADKAKEKNKQEQKNIPAATGGGGVAGGSSTTSSTTTPNCDKNDTCGYKKYIDDEDYKKISGKGNCTGLKTAVDEAKTKPDKNIMWKNTDHKDYEFLTRNPFKKDPIPEQVYLPPRKQKLCFKGFDGKDNDNKPNGVNDEENLKKRLLEVGATEGYNLGEYYKEKKEKPDDDKYSYDVEPCNALKYSFYDLRDIILGYDMVEHDDTGTGGNLSGIFKKGGKKPNDDAAKPGSQKRKDFWEKNKECVWSAMLCGYRKGRDGTSGGTKPSDTDLEKCDTNPPSETEYPIGKDRNEGKNLQFLRWFTEWGEDYCKHYTREYKKLEEKCKDCNSDGNCGSCKDCKTACEAYRKFIKPWKDQYEKQSSKYTQDQKQNKYDKDSDANGTSDAREYLNKKIKNIICQTSGPSGSIDCNCMDKTSTQNSGGTNMPKSLEDPPSEYEKQCNCNTTSASKSATSQHSVEPTVVLGGSSAGSSQPDPNSVPQAATVEPASGGKSDPGTGTGTVPTTPDSSSINSGQAVSSSSSSKSSTIKPPDNMNCVEKAANEIRKEVATNINSNLKGTGIELNGECNKVDDVIQEVNGSKTIDNEKLKSAFPYNEDSCETEGTDRFKIGEPWKCDKINRRHNNLCLPPRREHMCIKKIEKMFSSTVNDKHKLLEEVMKAAKNEGIDILKKLKPQHENQYSEICDAMKYSFADIGDIIRGRDLWNKDPKYGRREQRLQRIFRYIYDKLEDKHKYNHDGPKYLKLRSDWWDTNREEIWKAMTCVAPNEAKFLKKDKNGTTISSQDKCGHDHEPPVDDYIPQRFRWFTEWSEYFCKAKKEEIEKLNASCDKCEVSGLSCKDDANGTNCKTCKEKCKLYSGFVKEWQQQFNIQSKTYNELYKKANDTTDARTGTRTYGTKRTPRTLEDDNNKRINSFLKEVKEKCAYKAKSADKYLDKTTHCTEYKFLERNKSIDKYAFNDKPKNIQKKCNCKISSHPMDKCPFNVNNNRCNDYGSVRICTTKVYENELNNWNNKQILHNSRQNAGVLLPPRRNHICIRNITSYLRDMKNMDDFKNELLKSAYAQGKLLGEKYKDQPTQALRAMKYSFADYGDIIKGTDMMNNMERLNNELNKILNENGGVSSNVSNDRKKWWDKNKQHIWHATLCGYRKSKNATTIETLDNTWCDVPEEDDTPQFLRWLEEWAKIFCDEKQKEAKTVVDQCLKKLQNDKATKISEINDTQCKGLLTKYRDWYLKRKPQWDGLKKAYNDRLSNGTFSSSSKMQVTQNNAEEYVKKKCPQCDCTYQDLDDMYNKITQGNNEVSTLTNKAQIDSIVPKETAFYKILTLGGLGPAITDIVIDATKDIISKGYEQATNAANIGIPTGIVAADYAYNKINDVINSFNSKNSDQDPVEPSPPGTHTIPQHDEPFNTDILSSTLPVGISFALGSIALLFYMKKKPKLGPTNLFRVIDIPQNDYGIPTSKSSNKYVPYVRHKGKTYIYVEGNEPDDYIGDISSSDLTLSSESEYEEVDINDIYPYKSAKHKTLIEVVLKHSTNNNVQDTYTYDVKDNSETPTNKLTEEEWNQLKKDFISQYLENVQNDLPNENTIDDDMPKSTQPNILPNNMEEKPFITSIQDRYLDKRHEDVTYNIDWNVPENITTNNVDIPKYVTSNNKYSGIDLINDSLNSGNNIYNELLKRKENELYGIKHSKNTTTNTVVKQIVGDPILNQLDLFDKWLDRHRDMCNQWNNKEEMLNQLNKEWNKENKEHLLYTSNIDDINKNNDEKHNMISTNTQINHERNDKTSLENLGSTNIPPNDNTRNNNGSQTRNLRTNISMDIHFDENNNNVTNEDDQLENSYNF
ncbi:erythrocyte membrane protein 1, PfEMP1, putative [Plasmodium sp. DRC-Itaito]|nr:erythrocyte membrane protein 1, PfEMP1, putative [Plasmodium sp. DRC-Itaito]